MGKELDDKLMFNIDDELEANDKAKPGPNAPRCLVIDQGF